MRKYSLSEKERVPGYSFHSFMSNGIYMFVSVVVFINNYTQEIHTVKEVFIMQCLLELVVHV